MVARWTSPAVERAAWWLLLGAALTLPLQNTATVDVGFTLRVPYVLSVAAVAVGLPFALRGWRALPRRLAVTAAGLVAVYLLAQVAGVRASLAGSSRTGDLRAVVYVADLVVGLGVVGLVAALCRTREDLTQLLLVVVAGATLGAVYAPW